MMERLTKAHYKASDGHYLACSEMCKQEDCTFECDHLCEVVERLAAYEDTERRPEEVQALNRLFDYALTESGTLQEQLALIQRFRELAEADKDGRLVVLPRTPGLVLTSKNELYIIDEDEGEIYEDGLYEAEIGMNSKGRIAVNYTTLDSCSFYDEDIGKTVFLTRKEAERALKEGGNG